MKTPGIACAAALLWLTLPITAMAETSYPKLGVYTRQVGEMTAAQRDTIARYDLAIFSESPYIVGDIRARHPDILLFFSWMPQNIVKWNENDTFWYPDTAWSLIRLTQLYALKNDWFLRDTNGERIPEWDGWAVNWTRYCPTGTYGTSKGMNYVEWLTSVAMPRITRGQAAWPDWGWGSEAYQGILFEILADCVGSFGFEPYMNADPDRDGLPEGIDAFCSVGGAEDSLSILYREMNEVFHDHLYEAVGDDLPLIINAANPYVNPSWWTDMAGVKLESWNGWPHPEWQGWLDWFYGLRDWTGQDLWGPGYQWAEWHVGHSGADTERGWDASILQVMYQPTDPPAKVERMRRYGLGTALLGDGYFIFTKDQWELPWCQEFDWDLGGPIDDYVRETYSGQTLQDTLYTRFFENGYIEVNPNHVEIRDIPPEDARASFWQPVRDLSAISVGAHQATLTFHTPAASPNPVDRFDLRFAPWSITAANWWEATEYEWNPIEAPPEAEVTRIVQGLEPSTTYHFAIRNWVRGRLATSLSNQVVLTTVAYDPNETSDVEVTPPEESRLHAAPSPSSGEVRIRLELLRPETGSLEVVDPQGRVARLLAETRLWQAGENLVVLDERGRGDLPAGVYWLRFRGDRSSLTTRLVISR